MSIPTWVIISICVVAVAVSLLAVVVVVSSFVSLRSQQRHMHDFQYSGYGGAGWSLYRCECGETEIDA